jgi:paired amphipathic helix protein Sin3a
MQVEEWRKTRRDMNKIWATVYQRNYHKSLDYRSFQFKQADKKALSSQSLAAEAKAVKRLSMLRHNAAPCLRYKMDDESIHNDIQCILNDGCNGSEPTLQRVHNLFSRFLHVFLGLRARDFEEIRAAAVSTPQATQLKEGGTGRDKDSGAKETSASPSPSVVSSAAAVGEVPSPKGERERDSKRAGGAGGEEVRSEHGLEGNADEGMSEEKSSGGEGSGLGEERKGSVVGTKRRLLEGSEGNGVMGKSEDKDKKQRVMGEPKGEEEAGVGEEDLDSAMMKIVQSAKRSAFVRGAWVEGGAGGGDGGAAMDQGAAMLTKVCVCKRDM